MSRLKPRPTNISDFFGSLFRAHSEVGELSNEGKLGHQQPAQAMPELLFANFPLDERLNDGPQEFLGNNFDDLRAHLV
jgi:hypothetical protein